MQEGGILAVHLRLAACRLLCTACGTASPACCGASGFCAGCGQQLSVTHTQTCLSHSQLRVPGFRRQSLTAAGQPLHSAHPCPPPFPHSYRTTCTHSWHPPTPSHTPTEQPGRACGDGGLCLGHGQQARDAPVSCATALPPLRGLCLGYRHTAALCLVHCTAAATWWPLSGRCLAAAAWQLPLRPVLLLEAGEGTACLPAAHPLCCLCWRVVAPPRNLDPCC